MRAVVATVLAVGLIVSVAAPAAAGCGPVELRPQVMALKDVTTTCMPWLDPLLQRNERRSEPCHVTWQRLAEPRLLAIDYRWPNRSDPELRADVDVVALFEDLGKGSVRPWVAIISDGDAMQRGSITVAFGPVGTFVVRTECVNGTGGCSDDYFRWRPGALTPLREEWVEQVESQLRPDYTLARSRVDFTTMTGTYTARHPKDMNCCPSATIEVDLELVGATLRARTWREDYGVPGR